MRLLVSVALAALAAGCTAQRPINNASELDTAFAGPDRCANFDVARFGLSDAKATYYPANGEKGLPANCEITGTLRPVGGSAIGVVYRLPDNWNNKVLGIGGGGWIGNVTLQAATEGLSKGYATLSTDAGHPPTNVWDTSWASNPEARKDFSYRGIHEMTVAGKELVRAYYAKPHRKAYFQGCSTGGRMALMEAQRYPKDYDAISAGAPVYTLQVQTSAILRNQAFARNNGGFTPADLQLAQNAAVAACDAQDGAKDGLINDPRQCHWDPAELQCNGAKTASCLAPAQVAALRTVYAGSRTPGGAWAMLPMNRGGEAGWSFFVGTDGSNSDISYSALNNLFPLALGRPVDLATFSLADVEALRATEFAKMYEAGDPNLRPFFAQGGKLLLWHGENDPGPSPVGTTDYARAVLSAAPAATQNMRYFLYPGVGHCAGGPGADQVGVLDALAEWDETGRAPDVLIGTKADGSLTRPHCAWPNVARYDGSGDVNDRSNWQCVRRADS